ncbi:hypothetical protein [Lactobacillus helveticus]|uniref:hypothetical protein n=1 Tax=Lactobacillus helveticus TaxID=1587 RepID=UPI001561D700|nr:hypothetical protein [Lactobacillus helveticus]NRN84113.1 hypothetical protein [Lactobacillus helveticus]NRN98901.1 hypothetical protein [Lactobacillus helveticus]
MYGDDDTHITGQITFTQIAEAIRHKKYGRDMREAIAQGFDQFIGILQRVSDLESEYSDLQSKYNDTISRFNDDENKISNLQGNINALSQRCDKIEEQHSDDIKKLQDQIDQLNNVVFGHVHEINYDKPQVQDSNDYYEVIDKSKKRHLLNKNPVSHELNYSAVNGKHNSIEIDTGVGHMKGEKL